MGCAMSTTPRKMSKRAKSGPDMASLLLAVASGGLYFAATPGFDLWPMSLVALVPLLCAMTRRRPGVARALILGAVFGLTANAGCFYWLVPTIEAFGGFGLAGSLAVAASVWLLQAGHFVLFALVVDRFRSAGLPFLWLVAPAFAACEYVYPHPFPAPLAVALHDFPVAIQVASLGGATLISALLALTNGAVYALFARGARTASRLLVCTAAAWLASLLYGATALTTLEQTIEDAERARVGIVQANMGLMQKRRDPRESLRRHREQSLALERAGPLDLIVWPETAVGHVVPTVSSTPKAMAVAEVQRGIRSPLLFGALTSRAQAVPRKHYNSAILSPGPTTTGARQVRYDKVRLLPFGEYFPLGDAFPALYRLSPKTGHFAAGADQRSLALGNHRIAVLICYEDILPEFVRRSVKLGQPNLLVNMTNDAWFGDTTAPWAHLALAKFRAVEHARYLVRATNSGVSAVLDPAGRVLTSGQTFSRETLVATVRYLSQTTPFSRWGNWPGIAGLLCTLAGLLQSTRGRTSARPFARG